MRVATLCVLLVLAGIATTLEPAQAKEFCLSTNDGLRCGVVPAGCAKASDLIPYVTIECFGEGDLV